jgi:hypothetical protein
VTEVTFAHDLHVLSTPPAFILSQDQTLQFRSLSVSTRLTDLDSLFCSEFYLPCSARFRTDQELVADFCFLCSVFKEPAPKWGNF